MALLSGTFTYKKYRIPDELPKNFKETLVQTLPRHAFREIQPQRNPEFSIGWVNAFDPMDTHLGLEKVLFGKYILLGIRWDRKSIPAALLKAQLSSALKAQLRERKGRKLSREESVGLRDTIKEKMLAAVSPTTQLFEVVWNYETQEVFFSSTAAKAGIQFAELFEESFKLPLEEQNLVSMTEAYIERHGLGLELIDLEAANFGS
ncbi:MAG: recombination-associated protein RdgC [Candidatus Sumerlaeaceae bacterium]